MKTYYLTLSKVFPSTHAKAGMNTCFEEKLRVYKLHTIRANYDFWKKRFEQIAAGKACLSIRQWVGKPYGKGSTQREIVRLTREDGIGLQELRIVNENYKGRGIMLGYVDGEQKKTSFIPYPRTMGLVSMIGLSGLKVITLTNRWQLSILHHSDTNMKLYITTPINARQEPTMREKLISAKHRVEMLKEILADDVQFKDYELISTFDFNNMYDADEEKAMSRCIYHVLTSDAIYLDHGWTASKGCNLEYRTAKIYGKQIFEHDKL